MLECRNLVSFDKHSVIGPSCSCLCSDDRELWHEVRAESIQVNCQGDEEQNSIGDDVASEAHDRRLNANMDRRPNLFTVLPGKLSQCDKLYGW